ncbi:MULTISPECIES: hypothetical protein [Anaerococcus]|uniref:Uncharacterized protein n=1 Tax=Anaerococcus octavius TaxID=54007 RepID=A0A2I1MBH6_9FIRM|nr:MULTISPECIES: hypothetical protein [Anaerococcus]MBS6105306.1 hypothetical protein [Anaerococcus sp.]PKZ17472.1 hypothetical protein CYJ34_01820 [Anaerococcus octavius]
MSENLGPIHYMMYEKIKFQDKITNYLLDGDTSKVDKINKAVSTDPLEDLIDQENIHGWLDSKIDVVENRLNYALNNSENTKEKLYEFGKINAQGNDFSNFNSVFTDLNMLLLDGMPCDRGLAAQIDNNGDLYLITNNNLHSKYESQTINPEDSKDNVCQGGHDHDHHESFEISNNDNINLNDEKSNYHDYRYAFLKGYFADSPYDVEMINGINFRIFQKN